MTFTGAVGRDGFGDQLLAALAGDGIDAGAVIRVEAPTGVALILVEADGENRIVVASGANDHAPPPRPDAEVAVWVTQAEVRVASAAATLEAARVTGALALVNPAPAGKLPAKLVARFDAAVVNETELAALGESRPPLTVLTLGSAGARILPDGPVLPALPAEVVDTTGAGDALVGGMAAALAEGQPPQAALRVGMAAASLAIEQRGCQPAMPAREAIERRLAASG